MPDFWQGSGYGLLRRDASGRLLLTDDFLRAYLARPELAPVEESCAVERRLHAALTEQPRRDVPQARIAEIADEDARENYRVFLRFRARLTAAPTLEACYFGLFRNANVVVAPLFVNQLVQVVLRNVLEGCEDGLEARAAEIFFRPQKATVHGGSVMAADLETVEMHATGAGFGSLGELLVKGGATLRSVELDVLSAANADEYWRRDERFDTVLGLGPGSDGAQALARVLEKWVAHLHQTPVTVTPRPRIDAERWLWHVGLDSEATALLNSLYGGQEPAEEQLRRLVALFELRFVNDSDMLAAVAGHPVYLGLAMGPDQVIRLKPQNLLVNLPLAQRS